MQTFSCGFDFGNSETCEVLYYRGQKRTRSIPSAIAQGSLDELRSLGIPLGRTDYVLKDLVDNNEYYIGELALVQARLSSTGRGDINRYWSKRSLHLLLTVAASLIDEMEFGLNVVTGLPVQTYIGDVESRERVRSTLEGTHLFLFNGKQRTVHVTVERVIMEGAGALLVYGIKKPGRQGVIDIGGRTTDLFVADIQKPVRHLCAGKPIGVEMAADLLNAKFQVHHGRMLSAEERRGILYAYASQGTKSYPVLYAHGEEIHGINAMVEEMFHPVGIEIASFVSSTWNESESHGEVGGSFAQVLLVGGGAHYFKREIKAAVPNAETVANPEEANATGYAAFAERVMQQSLSISGQ